jgi:hypothetical protein
MKTRYLIEGTWSGYVSRQSRVVHREYVTSHAFAEAVSGLGSIRYTDGTCLILSVKQFNGDFRKKGMKLPEIKGYSSLIRECVAAKVYAVSDLPKYEKKPESKLIDSIPF